MVYHRLFAQLKTAYRNSRLERLVARSDSRHRFVAVGSINTLIDFGILLSLTHAGVHPIAANYLSTACAFVFSFYANRQVTFRAAGGALPRQAILFCTFTLFGLWVLQPLVLLVVIPLAAHIGFGSALAVFTGKLAAGFVTVVWNYLAYSRIVFKR